jgi:hypothetical protein
LPYCRVCRRSYSIERAYQIAPGTIVALYSPNKTSRCNSLGPFRDAGTARPCQSARLDNALTLPGSKRSGRRLARPEPRQRQQQVDFIDGAAPRCPSRQWRPYRLFRSHRTVSGREF